MAKKQVSKELRVIYLIVLLVLSLWYYWTTQPFAWSRPSFLIAMGMIFVSSIAAVWFIPDHRQKWVALAVVVGMVVSSFVWRTENLAVRGWIPLGLGCWFVLAALVVAYWPQSRARR